MPLVRRSFQFIPILVAVMMCFSLFSILIPNGSHALVKVNDDPISRNGEPSRRATRANDAGLIFFEGFESNSTNTNGWTVEQGSPNGETDISWEDPKNGTLHLHFEAGSSGGNGYVLRHFDLFRYTAAVLEFEAYGNDKMEAEGASGEDFLCVDFKSSSSSEWIVNIAYWHGGNLSVNNYVFYRIILPSSLFTNSSIIRIRHHLTYDEYIHIDDIRIRAAPCDTVVLFEDNMEADGPSAQGKWSTAEYRDDDGDTDEWARVTSAAHTPTHSWWVKNDNDNTVEVLDSPNVTIPSNVLSPKLLFWHKINVENDYDGGWIQYSIDGGGWIDFNAGNFIQNGYTGFTRGCASGTHPAWEGHPLYGGRWAEVIVNLPDSSVGHRIRVRWRFESDGGWAPNAPNGWWIDDVRIEAQSVLFIKSSSMTSDPSTIYRYNGNTTISGVFLDLKIYTISDYNVTLRVMDRNRKEMILIENKTTGNNSLEIIKVAPGIFRFSYTWMSNNSLVFGEYRIMASIHNKDNWHNARLYSENDCIVTLISSPPFFTEGAVEFQTEPVNVMDHRGIPLTVHFRDLDEQSPDDYNITLILNGDGGTVAVMKNASNAAQLDIVMTGEGYYEAHYLWYPEDPNSMTEGNYSIRIVLREGAEYRVNLSQFNVTESVELIKRHLPLILSISCEPSSVNTTEDMHTAIRCEFVDVDTLNIGVFSIELNLRGESNKSVTVLEDIGHGESGMTIQKTGPSLWTITYEYDPPAAMPEGNYDIEIGIADGETDPVFERFDNNTDKLFLYNNSSPVIEEAELSVDAVNIYGNATCRFSAVFSDPDYEEMANYRINLSLRDPQGRVESLLESGSRRSNPAIPYLDPLVPPKFLFSYDIDPPEHFTRGDYEIFFEVKDGWNGSDRIDYGKEGLELSVFYNGVPTPPGSIWPNRTSDSRPLISWWGAEDEETPYDELRYHIRIGTSPGDDTILPWYDNGRLTEYRMTRELGVGLYYIQVKTFDGERYSDVAQSSMTITQGGNTPPSIPGKIEPRYTVARNPRITWGPSDDPDVSDIVEYYISIGTDWHLGDIIRNTPTGTNTYYQFQGDLEYGTYFVQIMARDDEEYSPVREQRMTIFDPVENIPPMAPSTLVPTRTRDPTPNIQWEGHMDLNEDPLFFWVWIGTSSGTDDILSSRSTGRENHLQIEEALDVGNYFVQIKCHDGHVFSETFETRLEILSPRNLVGPDVIQPGFSTDQKPEINWSGAHYEDSPTIFGNYSYYVQLGTDPSKSDIMESTFVANRTYYMVTEPLPMGVDIYAQITATDGSFFSDVSVGKFRVGEFRITVGFDVVNYVLHVKRGGSQSVRAFLRNYGVDNITVRLSVEGTMSRSVTVPNGSMMIPGLGTEWLSLDIDLAAFVDNGNQKFTLVASTPDGKRVERSEPLLLKEKEEKGEGFFESMGANVYILISSVIILITLVLVLILIIRLWKREKRERFDLEETERELEKASIDSLLPPDLYSTFRFTERRGLKEMDAVMMNVFKKYGVINTAGKVHIKKKVVKALGDGRVKVIKRKVKALPPGKTPPKPPAHELASVEDSLKMPPLPGEAVELLIEGESPEAPVEVPAEELAAPSEFEYIPPEDGARMPLGMEGVIVDVEDEMAAELVDEEIGEEDDAWNAPSTDGDYQIGEGSVGDASEEEDTAGELVIEIAGEEPEIEPEAAGAVASFDGDGTVPDTPARDTASEEDENDEIPDFEITAEPDDPIAEGTGDILSEPEPVDQDTEEVPDLDQEHPNGADTDQEDTEEDDEEGSALSDIMDILGIDEEE